MSTIPDLLERAEHIEAHVTKVRESVYRQVGAPVSIAQIPTYVCPRGCDHVAQVPTRCNFCRTKLVPS